jgi:hypothetical protein
MSVRVVLYAEGAGDAPRGFDDSPAWAIAEDDLGPAHVLVRRALARARGAPEPAVTFRGRYRDEDGGHLTGSDLLDRDRREKLSVLHELADDRVDLVLFLIDRDGEAPRTPDHLATGWTAPTPLVVGVPREELEAWLLGDATGVSARLSTAPPARPEELEPGAAKAWLQARVADVVGPGRDAAREVRADLARRADLDRLDRACPSFAAFRRALAP